LQAAVANAHSVTLKRTTPDGYSYTVHVSVALGQPTLDTADAAPCTTDVVVPLTLLSGTLTNTTAGGHDMTTELDYIDNFSLSVSPALPASSYTCTAGRYVRSTFAMVNDLIVASPYAGCARVADYLIPRAYTGLAGPLNIRAGQSIPLTMVDNDPIGRSYSAESPRPEGLGAVTVNVQQADAAKVAADFSSADVCVLLSDGGGSRIAGSCG
jgi:hypothetical protein